MNDSKKVLKAKKRKCRRSGVKNVTENPQKRFSALEVKFLESKYLKNSVWDTAKTQNLAEELACKRKKVYKWHYDRK